MKVRETELPEVMLIEPRIFCDDRGRFLETYSQRRYEEALKRDLPWVQDNFSCSRMGTLRGLHYQVRNPQAKLIWVISGEIYDVAVDIRPWSPTFRHWISVHLDDTTHQQLFIPEGFAHGFCAVSEPVHIAYKCSSYYDPEDETGIAWDDPEIAIRWPLAEPVLSVKDKGLPRLAQARLPAK